MEMSVLFSLELVARFKIAIIYMCWELFSEYLEFCVWINSLPVKKKKEKKEKWVSVRDCMTACYSHMMPYCTKLMKSLCDHSESDICITADLHFFFFKKGKAHQHTVCKHTTRRTDWLSTSTELHPTEPDCLSSSSTTQKNPQKDV